MHCCCCCCCSWSCCRWSLGHDLAAKKQCPLSVDPGMVNKPAPGNRAGARGFAGRARGPSAPGVRANGRVMHRRPRRWTPTPFPGGSSPATGRKSHKKAKKFKVIIGSTGWFRLNAKNCVPGNSSRRFFELDHEILHTYSGRQYLKLEEGGFLIWGFAVEISGF